MLRCIPRHHLIPIELCLCIRQMHWIEYSRLLFLSLRLTIVGTSFLLICADANFRAGKLRDPIPSQALYLHCRFAALACDHIWLEDLIVGAMDRVEEVVMANPNDLVSLSHWLFNTTLLLHLLRCDESTSQICEILGLFGLLEEMVNVIYG